MFFMYEPTSMCIYIYSRIGTNPKLQVVSDRI